MSKKAKVDVEVSGGGTVFLLTPKSKAGKAWMDEHLPEDAQRWGDGVAVEHSYVGDIAQGMVDDGLTVA